MKLILPLLVASLASATETRSYPVAFEHTIAIPKRERKPEDYKGAKAYLVEKRRYKEREADVLVLKHVIPLGSRVRFEMDETLDYFLYETDWKVIVGHSKPYFRSKVLSIPAGAPISNGTRKALLAGEFLVNTFDLEPSKIVAFRENLRLPEGVRKATYPLPWDDWNPNGNWAHAIGRALAHPKNRHLVSAPPADLAYFCPKIASLSSAERVRVWQTILAEMSWRESSFVPFTFSDEGKYTAGAEGILSTGLMQLSLASTKNSCYQARGCQLIQDQKDLFHPEKNLTCAVGVVSCLTEDAHCFTCRTGEKSWLGAARYWSVLREKHTKDCPTCMGGTVTLGKKEELRDMLAAELPFCNP